jgi:pSer/pThr/pTyr-binding forkhead associated (FHA) protein
MIRQLEPLAKEHDSAIPPGSSPDNPFACRYWLVNGDLLFALREGVNTLGRSSYNDVVLEDFHVSRRHGVILIHHDRPCELLDTASRNGTYLNGSRLIRPGLLKSGDEIRLGNHTLLFLATSDLPDWSDTVLVREV